MITYLPDYLGPCGIFSIAFSEDECTALIASGLNVIKISTPGDAPASVYTSVPVPANSTPTCTFTLPEAVYIKLSQLRSFDVVEIDEKNILRSLYQFESNSNALITGMACNSNCVMCPCSERSRMNQKPCRIDKLMEIIRYIPRNAPHITVTGGEPTLLRDGLFELMQYINENLPQTFIQYLTNGRAFADPVFGQNFSNLLTLKDRVAIPIHGHTAGLHDLITRSPGSFHQTMRGIKRLEASAAELEIRVVVSRLNFTEMIHISELIIDSFQRITCVNFMGMEMLGNAVKNAAAVWIDYKDAFSMLKPAIDLLVHAEIDVELYNFPLCCVERGYWGICTNSISDYKISYYKQCEQCKVRSICGGFFDSTGRYGHLSIIPVNA